MYNVTRLDLIRSYKNYLESEISHLFLYRKKYKNYPKVIFQVLTNRYPIAAKARSGIDKELWDYPDAYNSIMGLETDPHEDIAYVRDLKFYGGKRLLGIVGIFIGDVYKFLPVKDRIVVDVGASIADSCIYFASQGAKRVIALEPDARVFEMAKRNIEVNNFSDNIELIRAGCTGISKDGFKNSQPEQNMTLRQIIDKCEPTIPRILKLGCLGCEYDVLLNTPDEIISSFSHIQVQFHYGYRNIKQKLMRCGFNVEFCGLGGPTYVKNPFPSQRTFSRDNHTYRLNSMCAGSLCARKK